MNIISFLLDICPFVGGLKMIIEACFKKELTGTELVGKARGIHLLFGIISLIMDFMTAGLLGSFGRGLFKLLGKGFLRRTAVMAARKAGRGTVARSVLRGTGRTIGKMEKNVVGRAVVGGAERYGKDKLDLKNNVERYKRDQSYRQQLRGEEDQNPNSRREILSRQRLENPKQQNNEESITQN